MIAGMTTFTFTLFQVVLGLIGILSGLVVVLEMRSGKKRDGTTALFLITTAATTVTGFMFPYHGFTPGIGIASCAP